MSPGHPESPTFLQRVARPHKGLPFLDILTSQGGPIQSLNQVFSSLVFPFSPLSVLPFHGQIS
jgi:hypothetical protein